MIGYLGAYLPKLPGFDHPRRNNMEMTVCNYNQASLISHDFNIVRYLEHNIYAQMN